VTGERVAQYTCWDGSIVPSADSVCPPQTVQVQQPVVVQQVVSSYNNCGASNVAIFNVPAGSTPKQLTRLGTLPEFGDSHELSATQFFEKLQGRYASDAADRAYLNYLIMHTLSYRVIRKIVKRSVFKVQMAQSFTS